MSHKDLISVIVPVFNVEKYLADCVYSILNQSYPEFEVILVDDGSEDESGRLCDDFQREDSRIRVIHKKNGGLSSARNAGMKAAEGKYICFIDSDDLIAENYLKTLYENAVTYDADVSYCCFVRFEKNDIPELVRDNTPVVCENEKLWKLLTSVGKNCNSTELVVAWNKLIKRELVHDMYFPVGKWHEDEYFINRLLMKANRFVMTEAQLYFYRKREESIVGNKNVEDVRHLDIIGAFQERVEMCRNQKDKLPYRKMVSAYRSTLIIQYHNFHQIKLRCNLKICFLKSFFLYPSVERHLIKSYLIFVLNTDWYYRKYWN